jgi:hypothetical protein
MYNNEPMNTFLVIALLAVIFFLWRISRNVKKSRRNLEAIYERTNDIHNIIDPEKPIDPN